MSTENPNWAAAPPLSPSNRLYHDEPQRQYLRAAKTALHEAGHLLGLEHCWEIDCLMRFSKHLDQLDRLPMHFCDRCAYEITRRLSQFPAAPPRYHPP